MSGTRRPIRCISAWPLAIFASMLPAACQQTNPPAPAPTGTKASAPTPAQPLPLVPPHTPANTIAPPPPPPAALSGRDANAIVAAASQAQYQTRTLDPNNWDHITIPHELWPPALADLHPIRIWQHHGNVVIVLSENDRGQDGWYVKPGISSFFPTNNSEATFEPMTAPGDAQIEGITAPFKNDSQLLPAPLRSESAGRVSIRVSALYRYHSPNPSWGPPAPKTPPK